MQTTSEATSERVRQAYKNATDMMRNAGFEIGNAVQVDVDPQLSFMGYTIPQGRNFRIVVSGMAVDSGMLEGLLVHEMSHIYRMQTNHPSHNARIIEEAVNNVGKRTLSRDYQQKIIHDLLNDIQDLYADDIAFQVLRKSRIIAPDQMSRFLQDWVKDQPVESNDNRKGRWINASIMVHNARAIGQMARHGVEDTDGKAASANERFLSRMPTAASRKFKYFQNLLKNLKEEMTEEDYRRLLANYLNTFLEIAEKN